MLQAAGGRGLGSPACGSAQVLGRPGVLPEFPNVLGVDVGGEGREGEK